MIKIELLIANLYVLKICQRYTKDILENDTHSYTVYIILKYLIFLQLGNRFIYHIIIKIIWEYYTLNTNKKIYWYIYILYNIICICLYIKIAK